MIGAVSAANETDAMLEEGDTTEELSLPDSQETISDNTSQIQTSIKSNDTNIVKGHDFSVELTDSNSTPLANKTVTFTVDDTETNQTTDEKGIAKLKINLSPGKYTVKYSFSEEGYVKCENSTRILVISTSTSKIKADDYVAYVGFKNKFTVTLKVGNTLLSKREVTFKINGHTYTKKTDSKGRASININEPKGKYKLSYSYAGEDNIKAASGHVKVTVKKGMPVKIIKKCSSVFRHKTSAKFKVLLKDARGNPVSKMKVTFKFKGKKYTAKTNKKGIVYFKIKSKIGSYKVKASVAKSSKYAKASKTYKIKVKPKQARNNGMWLLSADMKSVNFDKLEKVGTKHIFLNAKALERFGKKYVESWIKTAKSHKIKVHLWMQVFYNMKDGWISPVSGGKIKQKLITSKVKEAKKYARVKGVAGVHFDYLRFPGDAHQHKNGMKAVTYFAKKASKAVHKVNKKLIVSAAVMPEPSSMKKYYGQDIPALSRHLDVIIPMVYKGNYHGNSNWIKQVTKTFAKQSKKAKIWTGLQTYRSDSSLKKVPASELMGDADAAALGGAYGVILFRYGLIDYINFNEV